MTRASSAPIVKMRDLFAASLSQPLRVSEARTPYEPARPRKRSRRRG
jgi:hypothetical protein